MTYPLGEDPLDGKPCEKCPDYATNCAVGCDREGDGHDSDCATHNAPAYPKLACDCSAHDDVTQYNPWRSHIYAVMEGGSYFGAQDWNDLLAYMDSEHKKILNLDDQVRQLNSMVRQYETALRIKKEEHDCCSEDLRETQSRLESLARTVMGDMGNHREPLTTLQINALVADVYRNCGHMQPTPEIIVRAIERAHGIVGHNLNSTPSDVG